MINVLKRWSVPRHPHALLLFPPPALYLLVDRDVSSAGRWVTTRPSLRGLFLLREGGECEGETHWATYVGSAPLCRCSRGRLTLSAL